ncbi:uncharacterized protein STEHIDRAFT_124707 [Stereum hirsutum FP-91666 SS1]|uniref:uncharacterized protein n=1 Tax=Stereum hirsutum (strain FP-91666) TaxID=721885 RepID=UPI0004449A9C|nr:uncharacterized protein STEHIDRAFT_124707 [Stereum hirsutum FP-91666 SS1]EIM81832.1 hypothetical protein STEHIDRAFT_124707 [Stereum hirsutum FP-91666 SS1]
MLSVSSSAAGILLFMNSSRRWWQRQAICGGIPTLSLQEKSCPESMTPQWIKGFISAGA